MYGINTKTKYAGARLENDYTNRRVMHTAVHRLIHRGTGLSDLATLFAEGLGWKNREFDQHRGGARDYEKGRTAKFPMPRLLIGRVLSRRDNRMALLTVEMRDEGEFIR